MTLFPKKDIKNMYGQVIWFKDRSYTAIEILSPQGDYTVMCELIGNEYPILSIEEINRNFYTIEDQRDIRINDILK